MLKGYEVWAVAAYQAPIDANAADVTLPSANTGIDMSLWSELLIIIELGVLNNSATDAVTVSNSSSTNGTYANLAGKSAAIVGTDDGFIYIIALNASELDAGCRFVRVVQDNSAHSQLLSVLVLGRAVQPPATDHKIAAQQTIID